MIDGNVYLQRLSWDAYNEKGDIIGAVEWYRDRYGTYPEAVNADKIYWTRKNRAYLRSQGITMYGGFPLGRPQKTKSTEDKRRRKQESVKRNRIEGVFGVGKRRYGLERVISKTRQTSESWIAMVIFVMNVAGAYRDLVFSFCSSVTGPIWGLDVLKLLQTIYRRIKNGVLLFQSKDEFPRLELTVT